MSFSQAALLQTCHRGSSSFGGRGLDPVTNELLTVSSSGRWQVSASPGDSAPGEDDKSFEGVAGDRTARSVR